MGQPHHNVYVIHLAAAVLKDRRFKAANPKYTPGMPCVYVGCTGRTPEERFDQHQRGYKANRYARKFGLWLLPNLYRQYNPMAWEEALKREEKLAEDLRAIGWAVWQH